MMLVTDLHKLCRLCLTSGTQLVDIFSPCTDFPPSLDERINLCLTVKVCRTDTFPTKLCLPCLESVDKFYTFRLQAASSQNRLQELFSSGSGIPSDKDGPIGTPNLTQDVFKKTPQVLSSEGEEPAVSCLPLPLKDPVCSNKIDTSPKKTSGNEGMAICTSCSVHLSDSNRQLIGSVQTPCSVCNQTVDSKPSRDCRKYVCSVCDYSNVSLSNFKIHMMKHSREHVAYCRYCNKGFYSRTACTEHELVKHEGKSPVSCEKCNKSYHSKAYLRLHLKTHHPDFKNDGFQCDVCGKTFKSSKGVKRHKMADHVGRLYRCDVCDKEMKSLDSLKNHLKIHQGETPFVCLSCGKAFRTKNGLSVHERIHSGSKPFTCQICGSSFTQSSSLKIHVRYHKGDRPFQCCDCSKGFVTFTLLKMHQVKHHGTAQN